MVKSRIKEFMSIRPQIRLNTSPKSISWIVPWLIVVTLCLTVSCFGQQSDTITYTYDSLNRLTAATYANGATITYTYDAAGNRTSIQVTGGAAAPILRIDTVAVPAGRTSGGQQIRLIGSFASLSAITLGGTAATWFYTNGAGDTSSITITTPAHAVGAVTIDLTSTSAPALSKPNAFAYLPTVFTDNLLVANVTTVQAQHIIELRQAVDALRAVAGLSGAPWTEPSLVPGVTPIRAVHIQELRTFLDDVMTRLGYATQPYTDPGLTTGYSIKRVHIEELRQRVRTIAG